ncbi:MAG: hypothetical protein ACR2OG_03705 [Gemmatimonadaceae bacterium]
MSRAFVNEDADGPRGPARQFDLPTRDDPGFAEAAARALIDAAVDGDTESAEQATGFYWGDDRLRPQVQRLLSEARIAGDGSRERAAQRYLR